MKRITAFLTTTSLVCLTACSPLKPIESKPIAQYSLNQISRDIPRYKTSRQTLLVTSPVASPGFDTDGIVYLTKPYQLSHYAQNRWVSPPAKMILPSLVQTLVNTQYYHAVVATPFSGMTDLRLDTQLLKLQHEFSAKPSKVRLILQAQLIDNLKNKVIASRRFEVIENAPQDNPYGGVIAANKASAQALEKIARFSVVYSRYVKH